MLWSLRSFHLYLWWSWNRTCTWVDWFVLCGIFVTILDYNANLLHFAVQIQTHPLKTEWKALPGSLANWVADTDYLWAWQLWWSGKGQKSGSQILKCQSDSHQQQDHHYKWHISMVAVLGKHKSSGYSSSMDKQWMWSRHISIPLFSTAQHRDHWTVWVFDWEQSLIHWTWFNIMDQDALSGLSWIVLQRQSICANGSSSQYHRSTALLWQAWRLVWQSWKYQREPDSFCPWTFKWFFLSCALLGVYQTCRTPCKPLLEYQKTLSQLWLKPGNKVRLWAFAILGIMPLKHTFPQQW